MSCISIIVPVYNVEKYIHRCIDSILAQTFTDFELILVDDGSPDNCGKICDEYAEKDCRIHVIHKVNGGLSDARNAGIDWTFANSDSEWITFIDSDDWIHPKYMEALYNAVKETGCEISICGYEETTGDSPKVDDINLQAVTVNTEDFFCEHNVNAVIACAKLYKKELFRGIRYPVGKLHEDEFTTYKLLFQCDNCGFIKEPLYAYYRNEASITQSTWTPRRLDAYDALLSQIDYFCNNGFIRAEYYLFTYFACFLKVLENKNEILDNYEEIYRKYKSELKNRLRKYRPGIQNCSFAYEYAYPLKAKIYWLYASQIKKLRRKK